MAKGVRKGAFSRKRLLDMEQRGIPISALTAEHEGNPSADSVPHTNVYPDGYSGANTYRGGHYAHNTTTTEAVGTVNGYPVSMNGVPRVHNTRGYA